MKNFIDILADPEKQEMVTESCKLCDNPVSLSKALVEVLGSGTTVCPQCKAKLDEKGKYSDMATTWENLCPPVYRETSLKHEGFNRPAYEVSRGWGYDQSLVFLGPSGSCKTRIMMQRIKVAISKGYSVKILWADEIREMARGRDRMTTIKHYCLPDILGMDDLFLAGASSDIVAEFVYSLVDRRFREKKMCLITSQLSAEEYLQDANKFNNVTAAEQHRISAIIRRVREFCKPIDCDIESQGEIEF